jgi:hypothetical protein
MSAARGFSSEDALVRARAALDDALNLGLGIGFRLEIENPRLSPEPSIVFDPARGSGILHEDVLEITALALRHEGRLWIQHAAEWSGLAILWPVYDPPGPGGREAESPVKKSRRAAREGTS